MARGGSAAAAIIPATLPPAEYALPALILRVYGDDADDLLLPAVGGGSFDLSSAVGAGGLWGG
jgi:hypothetical protein